jgi:hypothetical protein
MQAWAKDTERAADAERVAKLSCLRSIEDAPTREAILALARRGLELAQKGSGSAPWCRMTLGMAEFRNGNHEAAEEQLRTAVETAADTAPGVDALANIQGTSDYYRAMSLFKQGKEEEARTLFATTAESMRPCPADELHPLPDGCDHDHLILWLAYKEARELLGLSR